MTRQQRIQDTLNRSDFLGTRRGIVSTDDLRRFVPPAPAPAPMPVTLPRPPYAEGVRA